MGKVVKEFRFSDFDCRENDDGLMVVEGTVMLYGDINTVPWGTEEVRAGAFGDVTKADVEVNRRHIRDEVVAATGAGLKLTDSEERLMAEVTLQNTPIGRQVGEEIKSGLLTGFSMEMRAIEQELVDNYRHRILSRLDFGGFGIVWRPAYPQSTLEARDWRPYLRQYGYDLPEDPEPAKEPEPKQVVSSHLFQDDLR